MKEKALAYLAHLGMNMWADQYIQDGFYDGAIKLHTLRTPIPKFGDITPEYPIVSSKNMRFDKKMWREIILKGKENGCNMMIIDIGEGLLLDSHPELAATGAWTKEELFEELDILRKNGIEPIPKLNFSACHDNWLCVYAKMLCTPTYYKVCADVIREVCELFETPRFFHIGMDEEDAKNQTKQLLATIRQGDLWWHDLYYFVKQVESCGSRAMMWSDYIWDHFDEYLSRMSNEVVQCNWYYADFNEGSLQNNDRIIKCFSALAAAGYDQMPTGSTWYLNDNFSSLAKYITDNIDTSKVIGFMQTPWVPTQEKYRDIHNIAMNDVGVANKILNKM